MRNTVKFGLLAIVLGIVVVGPSHEEAGTDTSGRIVAAPGDHVRVTFDTSLKAVWGYHRVTAVKADLIEGDGSLELPARGVDARPWPAAFKVDIPSYRPDLWGERLEPTVLVELPPDTLGLCILYTSPSPRDQRGSRMPSSA